MNERVWVFLFAACHKNGQGSVHGQDRAVVGLFGDFGCRGNCSLHTLRKVTKLDVFKTFNGHLCLKDIKDAMSIKAWKAFKCATSPAGTSYTGGSFVQHNIHYRIGTTTKATVMHNRRRYSDMKIQSLRRKNMEMHWRGLHACKNPHRCFMNYGNTLYDLWNPDHVLGEVEFPLGTDTIVDENGDVVGMQCTLLRILSRDETINLLKTSPSIPGSASVTLLDGDKTVIEFWAHPQSSYNEKSLKRLRKQRRKAQALARLGKPEPKPEPKLEPEPEPKTGAEKTWREEHPMEQVFRFVGSKIQSFDDLPAIEIAKSPSDGVVRKWINAQGQTTRVHVVKEAGRETYTHETYTLPNPLDKDPCINTTSRINWGCKVTEKYTTANVLTARTTHTASGVVFEDFTPGHEARLEMDASFSPHGTSTVAGPLGLSSSTCCAFPRFPKGLVHVAAKHGCLVPSAFPHMPPCQIVRTTSPDITTRYWAAVDGSTITQAERVLEKGLTEVVTECTALVQGKRVLQDVGKMPARVVTVNGKMVRYARYNQGRLHTRDPSQPSVWDAVGTTEYHHEGKLHRQEGPAVMCSRTNRVKYYLNGVQVVKKETKSGPVFVPRSIEGWDVL